MAGSLSCLCLLYTSDAADEEDSVDLGGRRIIKKKKRGKHGVTVFVITKKIRGKVSAMQYQAETRDN